MNAINEMISHGDQYKAIAISTCHLLESDGERLLNVGKTWQSSMILSRDTGAFVKLFPDLDGVEADLPKQYPGFSSVFYDVLSKAKSAGFLMVEFDCDAPGIESLPVYDW